jgi:hypothetical protein
MKKALSSLVLMLTMNAHALTVGAYNIRNFDYDERAQIHTNKNELANIIKSLNVDLLNVEEVVNTKVFEQFVASNFPGYDVELTRCGGEHNQHLGFVYNKAKLELIGFTEDLKIADPGNVGGCNSGSRPMAIGLFEIKATKQRFYGIALHLKSGSAPDAMRKRSMQFEVIKNTINELKAKSGVKDFFFAGDMNTTEYLSRGGDFKALTNVVSALGMVDVTANLACSAYWWGGSDDKIETPSLLDHIVVTPGLMKTAPNAQAGAHCKAVSCKMAPIGNLGASYQSVSDHCPVTSVIQ